MKNIKLWLSIILFFAITSVYAQNNANLRSKMFNFSFSYKGDFVGVPVGGLEKGFGYLGYGVMGVSFDTEAAHWWKGGQLVVSGATTHGICPSQQWIGDFQIADNIEAGNHIFLNELYFQQNAGPVCITAGMHDFNAYYARCNAAGLFINSSFGINSILSSTFGVPIFPIFSWGMTIHWQITDWVNWQIGAYDSPYGFDENPYNIHWRFNKEKGAILATEFSFNTNIHHRLNGAVTLGGVYQTALRNYEIHLNAEQQFWKKEDRNMAVFVMAAYSPKVLSENYFHTGIGLNFTGVFSKAGRDQLGIATSSSVLNNSLKHETIVELTYQYAFKKYFYLQPNIQFIHNPSGMIEKIPNALFLALRFGIDFSTI